MNRELTCIICPRGCRLQVTMENDGATVTGNACPKGQRYGIDECTHPVRTVTAVVRVANREDTMVSVKTEAPIPKESVFALMDILRGTQVQAPVASGEAVLTAFGTRVVTTKAVP